MSDTVTAAPTDEALEAARWDLEPLVDDGGPERALAQLDEAQERADAFAERYRGQGRRARRARRSPRRCASSRRSPTSPAAPAPTPRCAFSVDTLIARGRRADAGGAASARRRSQTTLLFFDLEWNELDDERAEELLGGRRARVLPPLPADRAPLPAAPADRARGADPDRDRRSPAARRFARLFTEQTSAITVELSDADEPLQLMEALSRLQDPDRERRAEAAGAVTEALEPGLRTRAFIYNTLLSGQGDQGPAALVRALARLAQPRQRGLRRVGRGADRGGQRSLRARAALVPAEGEAARARPARRLRPDRAAAPRPSARIPYDEARELVLDCYRGFSPELGDDRGGVLHRRLHRRAAGAGQARRRLLLLRGARRRTRT